MIEVSLFEDNVERLKSIAHANALFSGGMGDNDPAVGLYLLLERVDLLEELADRYDAVMGSLNCDFEDMFPDWGKE